MKNLITIIALITITSAVFANTTPEVLVSTEVVEIVSAEHHGIFSNTAFDAETESLVFDTFNNISAVQIFNSEGKLEFQLPVMSNNVQINKNLFDSGEYRLGFVIEGLADVLFTEVTIK